MNAPIRHPRRSHCKAACAEIRTAATQYDLALTRRAQLNALRELASTRAAYWTGRRYALRRVSP